MSLRVISDPSAAAAALLRAAENGERSATLLGMTALACAASGQTELAQRIARAALQAGPDDVWVRRLALQLRAAD